MYLVDIIWRGCIIYQPDQKTDICKSQCCRFGSITIWSRMFIWWYLMACKKSWNTYVCLQCWISFEFAVYLIWRNKYLFMGVGGDTRDMARGPRRWHLEKSLETTDLTNQQTSDGSGMVWSNVLSEFGRTTGETGIYLDRCDIQRSCCRRLISLVLPC